MTTSSSGSLITLSFETVGIFNNILYSNSTMKFVAVLSSSVEMSSINITQISLNQHVIECIECERTKWENIVIEDIITTSTYIIFLSNSVIDRISNLTITDENTVAFHIIKTNVILLDNINIVNATSGIYLEQSQLGSLQNSMIKD